MMDQDAMSFKNMLLGRRQDDLEESYRLYSCLCLFVQTHPEHAALNGNDRPDEEKAEPVLATSAMKCQTSL